MITGSRVPVSFAFSRTLAFVPATLVVLTVVTLFLANEKSMRGEAEAKADDESREQGAREELLAAAAALTRLQPGN